jgi:molybdate transport system substrate-binding protein
VILTLLATLFTLTGLAAEGPKSQDPILVFAASSLTDVFGDIGALYEQESGNSVIISFAGSSTLARQIEHGAPADVFVSANQAWMDYLDSRGALVAGSQSQFGSGRLVVIAPPDLKMSIQMTRDFPIQDAFSGRLAIADPTNVPAGQYAKQALTGMGWWEELSNRLAIGHDVRAAMAFVERGACDVGIVYATDARVSKGVRVVSTFPDSLHDPIRFVAAVVERSGTSAGDFVRFLSTKPAQQLFLRAGFLPVRDTHRSPQ